MHLRIHAFLASILDGGEQLVLRAGRFTPATEPLVTTEEETGWDREQLWIIWGKREGPGHSRESTYCLSFVTPSLVATLTGMSVYLLIFMIKKFREIFVYLYVTFHVVGVLSYMLNLFVTS